MYKYYSAMRPIVPGGYPKTEPIHEIVNFDEKQMIPSIGKRVWGYIEYKRPLTAKDAADYELLPDIPYEDKPAISATTQAHPAAVLPPVRPVLPGPWKKCSFYTFRREKGDDKPVPHKVDGYTDGIYNYYSSGDKCKQWHAIHPIYGLSVAFEDSRKAAQSRALECLEEVRKLDSKKDARRQACADAIRAAEDDEIIPLF